jgi:hypothetical protein
MAAIPPLVVGITGASGAPYAVRLLEVLLESGREVHLAISPSGQAVIGEELGRQIDLDRQTSSLQHLRRPHARFVQNARREQRTRAENHTVCGKNLCGGMAAAKLHPHRPLAYEEHPAHLGPGQNRQPPIPRHIVQITGRAAS